MDFFTYLCPNKMREDMKKYYKVVGVNTDVKQLVVADNYADAVSKLMGIEDFDYLFGAGFVIYPEGEIVI